MKHALAKIVAAVVVEVVAAVATNHPLTALSAVKRNRRNSSRGFAFFVPALPEPVGNDVAIPCFRNLSNPLDYRLNPLRSPT